MHLHMTHVHMLWLMDQAPAWGFIAGRDTSALCCTAGSQGTRTTVKEQRGRGSRASFSEKWRGSADKGPRKGLLELRGQHSQEGMSAENVFISSAALLSSTN